MQCCSKNIFGWLKVCVLCLLWLSQTSGERKAIKFYRLGIKTLKPNYFLGILFYFIEKRKQVPWVEAMKSKDGGWGRGRGEDGTGNFIFHLWIWPRSIHLFFSLNIWKEAYRFFFTCSLMCRCTFSDPSQSRSKWDPSFVGAVLSQGRAGLAGFESCPCRSSEGARDLFYIKAKIEGLAWKCSSDFWPAVSLSCTVGTLQLPKWQYWFPPWRILYLPRFFFFFPYVLHIEGEKVQRRLLQVFLRSITKQGECTLIQSI